MSPVKIQQWATECSSTPTLFSVTISSDSSVAIVAVNQAKGIGAVIEASEDTAHKLLGGGGEGLEEAFARALVSITKCRKVVLTIALRECSQIVLKELLSEIRSRIVVE